MLAAGNELPLISYHHSASNSRPPTKHLHFLFLVTRNNPQTSNVEKITPELIDKLRVFHHDKGLLPQYQNELMATTVNIFPSEL